MKSRETRRCLNTDRKSLSNNPIPIYYVSFVNPGSPTRQENKCSDNFTVYMSKFTL